MTCDLDLYMKQTTAGQGKEVAHNVAGPEVAARAATHLGYSDRSFCPEDRSRHDLDRSNPTVTFDSYQAAVSFPDVWYLIRVAILLKRPQSGPEGKKQRTPAPSTARGWKFYSTSLDRHGMRKRLLLTTDCMPMPHQDGHVRTCSHTHVATATAAAVVLSIHVHKPWDVTLTMAPLYARQNPSTNALTEALPQLPADAIQH